MPVEKLTRPPNYFVTRLAENIFKRTQISYKHKSFCDAILLARDDDEEIHAHRIVLSSMSEYFRDLFKKRPIYLKAKSIKLRSIDVVVLKKIVNYIYTSDIKLDRENLHSVLNAALFLKINALQDTCWRFLQKELDTNNCLTIALFTKQICPQVYEKATLYAYTFFDEVSTGKQFLELSEEELEKHLSSDDLVTRSEENVFKSLVRWTNHDFGNREQSLYKLLSHVRFGLLSNSFIIETGRTIGTPIRLQNELARWLNWHRSIDKILEPRECFNTHRNQKRKVAVICGDLPNVFKVYTLHRELNVWLQENLPFPPQPDRSAFSMIVIKKKLILVGGRIKNSITNEVIALDLQSKTWSNMKEMKTGRARAAVFELMGYLYVIGGEIVHSRSTSSVERYDFNKRQWKSIARTKSLFYKPKVTSCNGLLYVTGEGSSNIDCYNPKLNSWTRMEEVIDIMDTFSLTAADGCLYVVGVLSDIVRRFDITSGTWTDIKQLQFLIYYPQAVSLDDRVYICGIYEECILEEYDPKFNRWTRYKALAIESRGSSRILVV